MGWLGKLIAAPIHIANLPFRVIDEVAARAMDDRHDPDTDLGVSMLGHDIAKGVERAVDEITGD